jgi:hypothetical protein
VRHLFAVSPRLAEREKKEATRKENLAIVECPWEDDDKSSSSSSGGDEDDNNNDGQSITTNLYRPSRFSPIVHPSFKKERKQSQLTKTLSLPVYNQTQNGVGAFILQCKKMDFHFCDWAGSSRGMK